MTTPPDNANQSSDSPSLDAETVTDLEPGADDTDDVRGGACPHSKPVIAPRCGNGSRGTT